MDTRRVADIAKAVGTLAFIGTVIVADAVGNAGVTTSCEEY
jgi:hypothetical protein